MKNIIHSLAISVILIGLLVGYAKADYNYDPFNLWNRYYYAWDKGKDILIILCILFPSKWFKWSWVVVGLFFVIREVWQVYAIKDYATASRPSVIFSLFLLDIFVICIIMLSSPRNTKKLAAWIKQLHNRLKDKKWPKVN